MEQRKTLRRAFDHLKENWITREGKPLEIEVINVVAANIESGRVTRVLKKHDVADLYEYVIQVRRFYQQWHPTVSGLQGDPSSPRWPDLYKTLIRWSYTILRKHAVFLHHAQLEESAQACAADTALVVMNQRFPYDTNFEAWCYVVLQRTTFNHMRSKVNGRSVPERELVNLDAHQGWLESISDPNAEAPGALLEEGEFLFHAIETLTEWQQWFVDLYYIEQFTYPEIAEITGRSISSLYKTRFDTIDALSKILRQEAYIYE